MSAFMASLMSALMASLMCVLCATTSQSASMTSIQEALWAQAPGSGPSEPGSAPAPTPASALAMVPVLAWYLYTCSGCESIRGGHHAHPRLELWRDDSQSKQGDRQCASRGGE